MREAHSTLSDETRRKMSESAKRRYDTDFELRQKLKPKPGDQRALGHVPSDAVRKLWSEQRKGRKLTLDQRRERAERQRGSNSHLWRGGVDKPNKLIRASLEYRLWREAVFARDNWTCVFCGARSGKGKVVYLHADHIKPFALYPELRFAIDNGRTLCVPCHKTTETFRVKALDARTEIQN